jgi:molecular chaperone HtpG
MAKTADLNPEDSESVETRVFQAEVGKVLNLVVNSLYSNKEIFLRELVSNASDACDQLRYAAITKPSLLAEDLDLAITVSSNKKGRTITIADNGIGMDHDELVANLGTIARSGTAAFAEQLTGDSANDINLIGQFGVGFYSAFMVADKVEVLSAKAGEETAWKWVSEGTGEFTVTPAKRVARGTTIELYLKKGESEFLDAERLRQIITTYSDHIAIPIRLAMSGKGEAEAVNNAAALWMRPRKEITEEQYTEFYHHVAHSFDEPWLTMHNKAEGRLEYTNLMFIPSSKPFDLFDPARKHGVKLYVKRVFITDDCSDLIPAWLRFVRGIVDSEDLPLNVSREMLQQNPVVSKIRTALVKRVLGELEKKSSKSPENFAKFWDSFGAVLKEGIYEDVTYRERLVKLLHCRSTASDELTTLGGYVARMKDGQEAIYYISGESLGSLQNSPQIEALVASGIEVIFFDDAVDEFWTSVVSEFEDKKLLSVTRGDIDLSSLVSEKAEDKNILDPELDAQIASLTGAFKLALGDSVKDVRVSERLTDSPVCLVADEGGMDIHLERLLKQQNQLQEVSKRILEINPKNGLIKSLAGIAKDKPSDSMLVEAAELLLDQARIIEGDVIADPTAFANRMTNMMSKALQNR